MGLRLNISESPIPNGGILGSVLAGPNLMRGVVVDKVLQNAERHRNNRTLDPIDSGPTWVWGWSNDLNHDN